MSVFDGRGTFTRSFTLDPPGAVTSLRPIGVFIDASLLVGRAQVYTTGPELRTGLSRDSLPYFRYSMEGLLLDTVGRFRGMDAYVRVEGRGFSVTAIPFGRTPDTWVHGDDLYFGAGETFEVAIYAKEGTLRRLIRLVHTNLAVREEDIARIKRDRFEDASDDNWRRQLERAFAEMPIPETMPAYADLLVDGEGNLWIEEYRRPGNRESRWTVFDAEGRMLGIVAMGPDFQPLQIGSGFVLGRWLDELDVEHIRLYRLVKLPAGQITQPDRNTSPDGSSRVR